MGKNTILKEFEKCCDSNGFAKLAPHYFARCVGDGVFQTIYTGFRQYVDVDSPNYDPRHRKDYFVSIGLRSMYTRWPESIFVPGKNCGGYSPADLLCMEAYSFEGISREYTLMLEGGFSALNALNSQESILQIRNRVMKTARGSRIHSFDLVAPYLMCGEIEDAFFEIDHQYTHSAIGFIRKNDRLLQEGEVTQFLTELEALKERTQEATELWIALIGRNYDAIHAYLNGNFEQNATWAQKYQIPFTPDFHKARALLDG